MLRLSDAGVDKMLSYHRETALQDTLVLAKNGRLELHGEIIFYGHYKSYIQPS